MNSILVALALVLPSSPIDDHPLHHRSWSKSLPSDWKVVGSVELKGPQLKQFSQRLGGELELLTNTQINTGSTVFKINVVHCKSNRDAENVYAAMLKIHKGFKAAVQRRDNVIVEFSSPDVRPILRCHYILNLKPHFVRYHVSFRAAPVDSADYSVWNKFFNASLNNDAAAIDRLRSRFVFGQDIIVRKESANSLTSITFSPRHKSHTLDPVTGLARYQFDPLPITNKVPEVTVSAEIHVEAFGFSPTNRGDANSLIQSTKHWPANDSAIQKLAKSITQGATSQDRKLSAILDWFSNRRNIRFGGIDVGTRNGTLATLAQRTGRCWDYSDLFVTMCRASKIPTRQVLGWLRDVSGHVWAEVLIKGKGWQQVDPTIGMVCGSDHIPYLASEDGEISLVYLSLPEIKVIEEKYKTTGD